MQRRCTHGSMLAWVSQSERQPLQSILVSPEGVIRHIRKKMIVVIIRGERPRQVLRDISPQAPRTVAERHTRHGHAHRLIRWGGGGDVEHSVDVGAGLDASAALSDDDRSAVPAAGDGSRAVVRGPDAVAALGVRAAVEVGGVERIEGGLAPIPVWKVTLGIGGQQRL